MDRITEGLLLEFCKEHGLDSLAQDKQFEYLASYLVVSRFQSETFDIEETVVGGNGDTGFDVASIIVNGALVTDPDSVEDLASKNKFLDVTFLFVQADRGPSFASAKIGQIGYGILDFFAPEPKLPRNSRIDEAAATMAAIYKKSSLFTKGNPTCRIYYVTTGKWIGDQQLEARRNAVIEDLSALNLFRDVDFIPVGAEEIHKLYRQTQNAISREFNFVLRTVVPEIPGVAEAYVGLLPASEFLPLIQDDNGNLVRSIFYDNVRDWQDYNVVNTGIRETVTTDELRPRFALMNNGVTIIAKKLRTTGNRFTIEDFQIVNGCQTSHVLYDQRLSTDDSVNIPVRLIATENEDVIASIIKATNRQTEVKEDQLLALSDFQKKLEEYFKTFTNGKRLYYERRSKQYNIPGIEKVRVVTMANLIRSFTAMFRETPHRTTRGYGELLDEVGKSIFGEDHRMEQYYLSAYTLYRLEFFFRNQTLDPKFKPARWHMLLAFRMLASASKLPAQNSHEMKRYCEPIMEILWDQPSAENIFNRAAIVVETVAKGNYHRDNLRSTPFTESVKSVCLTRKDFP